MRRGPEWVIELGKDWLRAYGGTVPWTQIGVHCKRLVKEYPFSQVQIHFRHYLAAHHNGKAVYASPARFAQTFNEWGPPTRSPVFTAYKPVSKVVREEVGGRWRLIHVPIDDPRPEA